jgi:hypothetical protein
MNTTSGLVGAKVRQKISCNALDTRTLAAVFGAITRAQRREIMERVLREFEPVRKQMSAGIYATAVRFRIYAIVAVEHIGCTFDTNVTSALPDVQYMMEPPQPVCARCNDPGHHVSECDA